MVKKICMFAPLCQGKTEKFTCPPCRQILVAPLPHPPSPLSCPPPSLAPWPHLGLWLGGASECHPVKRINISLCVKRINISLKIRLKGKSCDFFRLRSNRQRRWLIFVYCFGNNDPDFWHKNAKNLGAKWEGTRAFVHDKKRERSFMTEALTPSQIYREFNSGLKI